MIFMNERMKARYIYNSQTSGIAKSIVDKTKIINDCILYDEFGKWNESGIDFDYVLRQYNDKTGFEVSCSEIIMEREVLNELQLVELLFDLDVFFSEKYPKRKMVFYLIDKADCYDLRFHTYRPDESLWLDEDLNYDEPIIRYIS